MHLSTAQQITFDLKNSALEGAERTERRLSDLEGFFADTEAYKAALQEHDPLIYHVQSIAPADGAGDLHYGLGTLMPGRVGREYYLTKGHLHAWRGAAEVYLGLEGTGLMLLEEEQTGQSQTFALNKHSVVYVPGHVAHRTINCGTIPLRYMGIYPAAAGHDYGAIAERNFYKVVADINGKPTVLDRERFLANHL